MIERIHGILATRQPARYSRRRNPLWELPLSVVYAAEDVGRFIIIACVIIPLLAATFFVLGIFFHIPRMLIPCRHRSSISSRLLVSCIVGARRKDLVAF